MPDEEETEENAGKLRAAAAAERAWEIHQAGENTDNEED